MARVMSGMPEVVTRLLDEHVPDRLGRCTACGASGSGTRWPCTLAQIATQARALAVEQGRSSL
jgi:hypothetical protein